MKNNTRINYHLNERSKLSMRQWRDTSPRFLIARCPFERLLSVYFDKFISKSRLDRLWIAIQRRMDVRFAAETLATNGNVADGCVARADNTTVSFCSYVSYVHEQSNENAHWTPIATICHVNELEVRAAASPVVFDVTAHPTNTVHPHCSHRQQKQ